MLDARTAPGPGASELPKIVMGVDRRLFRRPGDSRLVEVGATGRRRGHGTRLLPLCPLSASKDPRSAPAPARDNGPVRGVPEPAQAAAPALLPGDEDALEAFAQAALALVRDGSLERSLAALARAVALGVGAQVVVVRLIEQGGGRLVARAIHAESAALAAELEGTTIQAAEIDSSEAEFASAPGDPSAPSAMRRIAARAGAPIVRVVPLTVEGKVIASLELYRSGVPFGFREQALARVAAAHLATAIRLERATQAGGDGGCS